MYVGLRSKILIGILALLALIFLSANFLLRNMLDMHFEREFNKRAVFSCFGIVERVRPLLARGDIPGIKSVLVRYQSERPDVRYIFVRGARKKIIAATAGLPGDLGIIPKEVPGKPYYHHHFKIGQDDIVDVTVPIDEGLRGYVHLGMSQASVIQGIDESSRMIMLVGFGIIVFGGILAGLMARILTRPIPELIRVSEAVGKGDLDQKVTASATDEMGALGRSINQMIEGLKGARNELLAAKDYTEKIVRSMGDILFVVGIDGRIKTVGKAAEGILGYGPEELIGQSIGTVYLEGESTFRSNVLDKVIRGDQIHDHPFNGRAKGGHAVPMSLSASPMQDAGGAVVIARDRSDIEKLLYEVDQIYNGSLTAMRVVDEKFNVISANEAFCKMTGVERVNVKGRKCYELFHSDRCRTDKCNLVAILRGKSRLDLECEREAPDGRKMQVRVLATPYRDHTGKLSGIIEVFSDITVQKKLIGELEQKTTELKDAYETQRAYADILTVLNSRAEFEAFLPNVLNKITEDTDAQAGIIYLKDESTLRLVPAATYALDKSRAAKGFALGEGLPGQAALEGRMLSIQDIPAEYFHLHFGMAEGLPHHVFALPISFGRDLIGVLELASCHTFSSRVLDNLKIISTQIGISIHEAQLHLKTEQLAQDLRGKSDLLAAQYQGLCSQSEELVSLNEELQSHTVELAAQKKALEEKTEQLQEANRLKSEFLSDMSHDLRTPLNAILGITALLVHDSDLTGRQEKYLRLIERNGQSLLQLTNDILDLSKIESGRLELVYTDMPLKAFFKDTVTTIEPLARQKKLDLEVYVAEDAGTISCDPDRLRQILINLLGNAIKFTDEGGRVSLSARPNGLEMVDISVADTGIGIPEESLPAIFEAFCQLKDHRKQIGTGLGLSIVKKLTTLLQGEISVRSKPGSGTDFTITLPREAKEGATVVQNMESRMEEVRRALTIRTAPGQDEKGPRNLLIIDDDHSVVREMGRILQGRNFNIESAEDGQKGLAKAKESLPDLILLDMKMPGMDGFDFLEKISKDRSLGHIPIVLVTAMDLPPSQMSRFKTAKVKAIISKGQTTTDAFLKVIETALAADTSESPPVKASDGERRTKVLIVDDQPDNVFLLEEILRPSGYIICTAHHGKEAVKVAQGEKPDLILMDVQMPVMDGYEAARCIRSLPDLGEIPIIALTARAMTGEDNKAMEEGCSDYLSKPVSPAEVLRKVTEWLKKTPS